MDARETVDRIAALVCEGGEATLDEVRAGLAGCIDQTLLDPCAGPERVAAWARENAGEGFAALCVQPCNVARVAWELNRLASPTRACGVLSFPHGQESPESVCFQVAVALAAGASELDLVMNYGAFLEGSLDEAVAPIQAALQTIDADDGCDCDETCDCDAHGEGCDCDDECSCGCHDHEDGERPLLKVIIETGVLTDRQICEATDLVSSLGVDFVKTSTGFGPRGATVDDVRLMCATAEPGVQVKAAGGIRTLEGALALLEAGATRLGTSHGSDILAEFDRLAATLADDAAAAREG